MPVLRKLIRYLKWELLFVRKIMIRMQSLKDTDCSAEGCFLIFRTFLGKRKESKKVLRKKERDLTTNREWWTERVRKDSLGKGLESKRQQRRGKTEGGEGEGVGRGECVKQRWKKGKKKWKWEGKKSHNQGLRWVRSVPILFIHLYSSQCLVGVSKGCDLL